MVTFHFRVNSYFLPPLPMQQVVALAYVGLSKRVRVVVVGAFGNYLRSFREALPTKTSVESVAQTLRGRGWPADDSALRSYEYGWIERPDPVLLLGLAEYYKTDIVEIISVLKANRENRELTENSVQQILQSLRAKPHDDDLDLAFRERVGAVARDLLEMSRTGQATNPARQTLTSRSGRTRRTSNR